MQGDLALNQELRERYIPDSVLKGEANLLMFPNLDSGQPVDDAAQGNEQRAGRRPDPDGAAGAGAHPRPLDDQPRHRQYGGNCRQRSGCIGSESRMIRHTVVFTLKHAHGSLQEKAFLRDAKIALEEIPGVKKFEQLRQVSKKNDYRFGFSMEFADQAAYDAYNAHPKHVNFVQDRWNREVEKFLEIDYELL